MIFAILSTCCGVMMSCSLKIARAGNEQRQHHGEAAEDRAGDEVRRENRRVPGRNNRRGEVEGHDAVHRENQRRGETGQQQIRHFVMAPVPVRAAPAKRENSVEKFLDLAWSRDRATSPRSGTKPVYQNRTDTVK